MKFSRLTNENLHEIESFAQRCFYEFRYPGQFNWSNFRDFWSSVFSHDIGSIIVARDDNDRIVGAVGLTAFRDPFNGQKQATVSFWHMEKGHNAKDGLRLFVFAIEEAKERECYRILHGHPKQKKFFERLGFQPVEVGYQKLF